MNFALWDKIADCFNPLLTLGFLLGVWRFARQKSARGEAFPLGRFVLLSLGCILAVYVAAHLNRWLHLWPGHKWFPSGHTAYACCVLTLWARLQPRMVWIGAPLILLYGALLVQLNFHSWLDIAGAILLAPALTFWLLQRFDAPNPAQVLAAH